MTQEEAGRHLPLSDGGVPEEDDFEVVRAEEG